MHSRAETVQAAAQAPDRRESGRVREALHALARPRLTGSPGAAQTERELRRRLRALGYEVRELPFEFSTWPGRFGVPFAGGLYGIGAGAAVWLLAAGRPVTTAAVLVLTAAALAVLARSARRAIAELPWGRVRTANWLAHRPGVRPSYLVVAHRDTKSQAVSTLGRTAAIGLALLAGAVLLGLSAFGAIRPEWVARPLLFAAAGGAGASALLLLCSWAGNASPGALDNASGLAALLGLAHRERDTDDVAFLITDGEELGLAGARSAASHLPPLSGVINLDGLDDRGAFRIIERYGWPRRGMAPHLVAALLASAAELGYPAERRALPFGVLVDHIAFAAAGRAAVTVMRGTVGSLQRVHRPSDDPSVLQGTGAAETVALVAGALRFLRRKAGPTAAG